jgi:very-short-patch-repair endonuclease
MKALDPPHDWWNAETTKPGVISTGPAGYRTRRWLVKADADRLGDATDSRIADPCPIFKRVIGLACIRSQQESGMDDERIWQFLGECQEDAAEIARAKLDLKFMCSAFECESEIERLLLLAFLRWEAINPFDTFKILGFRDHDLNEARDLAWRLIVPSYLHHSVTVALMQCPVSNYRVDFLLGVVRAEKGERRGEHWIAVECDGHDYHERTKEQARRDKSRDRSLMALGIKTMRFTGSEIWEDPTACALEALRVLDPDAKWFSVQGVEP